VLSGRCCSEYLVNVAFVEEVDDFFDNFNGGMHFDSGKALRCPHNNNSPHIDHWTKASMAINSLVFLKDGKPCNGHYCFPANVENSKEVGLKGPHT
jgi:hypothetical protein